MTCKSRIETRVGSGFRSGFVLVLAVLGAAITANAARCEPVFDPPGETLSIHPLAQHGELYGTARDSAAWHVAQWNNPGGDVADFKDGRAVNDGLSIEIDHGAEPHFKISQNGEQLRCEENGNPLEFDGFLGSNTKANNPNLPSAEHGDMRSVPLSKLGSLTQEISLKLNQAGLVGSRCAVSKSLSLVCVVFTNKQSKQTFFYQISLYGFNLNPKSFWWAKGRPNGRYGFNQVTDVAAKPWAVGDSRKLKLDILPAVQSLITSSGVGIDPNLDNWVLSAAYFGNTLYGQVRLETEWSSYRLEAVVK
jgi:hypothetical protein